MFAMPDMAMNRPKKGGEEEDEGKNFLFTKTFFKYFIIL